MSEKSQEITSLEIPPELLEFLKDDPAYVICPQCNNVWENAGAGNEDDCKHVKTDNGKLLSSECRKHYTEYRFRCQRCENIFCSSCKRIPYHLGFTCDSFESAVHSYKCRWCKETISVDSIASKGPPKDPERLVCKKCVDKDTACMSKSHPGCNHPAIWHHSMPSRKLEACIRPECVEKREKVSSASNEIQQTTCEDFCSICWVEELGEHPCLKLSCGHIFHAHCVKKKLRMKWEAGGPVCLSFLECPLCKSPISWPAICQPYVNELRELQEMRADLKFRCTQQLKYLEDLPEELKNESNEETLFDFGMRKLNFYECFQCKSFYYGGKKECDAQQVQEGEEIQLHPEELVCGGCRGSCEKHGTEQMVYKCRFCCSVASYFCFGHTHFCKDCHAKPWNIVSQNNYQFIVGKLPPCPGKDLCPLGISHPPNGEEFVLGCAYCADFVHLSKDCDGQLSTENPPTQ